MTKFEEGFNAYAAGDMPWHNPYPEGTDDFAAWHDGWLDHEEHDNAKSDALNSIGWFG